MIHIDNFAVAKPVGDSQHGNRARPVCVAVPDLAEYEVGLATQHVFVQALLRRRRLPDRVVGLPGDGSEIGTAIQNHQRQNAEQCTDCNRKTVQSAPQGTGPHPSDNQSNRKKWRKRWHLLSMAEVGIAGVAP